ncbi:GIY-YIG nuclease family protein [Thiofilum flexile]|uniref:GIY-YIG nuclease family protein n=1 Tax=Thiofilum flexile TaxID=125627 RepID=UPI000361D660|nr:GIY-YIG nuclease family protein [Thiofilum flexile]
MTEPFSITLFATTGDPHGIRHVDKSNWSGFGVVFTKALFKNLKTEKGFDQAGVYILVGNAAQETIYIGEGDPVGERLKHHVAKRKDWEWGVYFFDQNKKIGKTEVQFLEAELIQRAKKTNRAILTNKNKATHPSMSPASHAMATTFLSSMLQILPMLSINAFTEQSLNDDQSNVQEPSLNQIIDFDTIVVPAQQGGFISEFLENQRWFAIRIKEANIPKIKYIAAYQVSPIAAITHIASIASIKPHEDTGRYMVYFKEPAQHINNIPRLSTSKINMQSPRYAQYAKLLKAKHLDEVW